MAAGDENGNADEVTLSMADGSNHMEALIVKHVCTPLLVYIPAWIKPNTISLLNFAVSWAQVGFAFLAILVDETQEEFESGVMVGDRERWSVRRQALLFRILVAVCVFMCMVLDCLDGMHARATKQTSKLGEVVDHALDAANIPMMAVSYAVMMDMDQYTIAVGLLTGGMVFNSQLVVYRNHHRMIMPPTSGPEAQMLVVGTQLVASTCLYYFGRYSRIVSLVIVGVSIWGNSIQVHNTYYFVKHLRWGDLTDHLRFCLLAGWLCVLYLCHTISSGFFCLASILVAFRTSGMYVMFIVANQEKVLADKGGNKKTPTKGVIRSRFTTVYSGIDRALLSWLVLFTVVPIVSHADPSGLPVWKTTTTEQVLLALFATHILWISILDMKTCLPYLIPANQQHLSLWELFF